MLIMLPMLNMLSTYTVLYFNIFNTPPQVEAVILCKQSLLKIELYDCLERGIVSMSASWSREDSGRTMSCLD